MSKISGNPALQERLAHELFAYYQKKAPGHDKWELYEWSRTCIVIKCGVKNQVIEFNPRFVDAVELHISNLHSRDKSTSSSTGPRETREPSPGEISSALDTFDWSMTLPGWKAVMDSDPEASKKIIFAKARFNRSKGQFKRHDYEEFPSDYNFITSADDDLAMFIGYYRMFPVKEARGYLKWLLADKPMCLQLETLMEGF